MRMHARMRNLRHLFSFVLLPASFLYGMAVFIRNLLFDFGILKSERFPVPVISVGNITVGGTGKTPHVAYLVNLLKDRYTVAVLSRGYGRKTKGFILADQQSGVQEIGDESRLIQRRFNTVPVAVDENRVRGIRHLLARFPDLHAIVLDDAFQHRYVQPDWSLVLVDYTRPVFSDCLVPAGNLRESRRNLKRASAIVVSKCPPGLSTQQQEEFISRLQLRQHQPVYFTSLRYGKLIPVFANGTGPMETALLKSGNLSLLLITGIANPEPLKAYLAEYTDRLETMEYPDHYLFRQRDLQGICRKFHAMPAKRTLLVTTEKDAVRLSEFPGELEQVKEYLYYLPVEVEFLNNGELAFNQQMIKMVNR